MIPFETDVFVVGKHVRLRLRYNPQLELIFPYLIDMLEPEGGSLIDLVENGFKSPRGMEAWALSLGYKIPEDFLQALGKVMAYTNE